MPYTAFITTINPLGCTGKNDYLGKPESTLETKLWQRQDTERTIKLTIPWRAQSTAHKGIYAKSMGILLYPRREVALLALRIRYEARNINRYI